MSTDKDSETCMTDLIRLNKTANMLIDSIKVFDVGQTKHSHPWILDLSVMEKELELLSEFTWTNYR